MMMIITKIIKKEQIKMMKIMTTIMTDLSRNTTLDLRRRMQVISQPIKGRRQMTPCVEWTIRGNRQEKTLKPKRKRKKLNVKKKLTN